MPQRKPKPARTTPLPPDEEPLPPPPDKGPCRRRRHDAATHLLRGTCYGLGTGIVSLAVWWIQQHP
ncbi:hypothetical protein [Streptomyces sp. NPDC047123]|uniref:hypothetical protein n=1 Tax=Streptomyces sp. NPDC047123 TaxID=3155622 RepID=UPI0033C85BD5